MFLFSLMTNVFAGLLAFAPLMVCYQTICRKKANKDPVPFSWAHAAVMTLFSILIIGIISVTGVPSVYHMQWHPEYNLIPLMDITSSPAPYLLNMVLFFPLGFLLPALCKSFHNPGKTIVHGFLLSLMIESMQLFNYRTTDIDDLVMNTLGTALGYAVFFLFEKTAPQIVSARSGRQASPSTAEVYWCLALSWVAMFLFQSPLADWIWSLYYV